MSETPDTSAEAVAALCLRLVPADCNTVSTCDLARAVEALEALLADRDDLRARLGHVHGQIGLFAEREFCICNNLPTDETFAKMHDAIRNQIMEWKRAVAELCGWSLIAEDDDSSRCFWRNVDRGGFGTYDRLEDIPLTPDDVLSCLNAWDECRDKLSHTQARLEAAERRVKIACDDWACDDTAVKEICARHGIQPEHYECDAFKSHVECVQELDQQLTAAQARVQELEGERDALAYLGENENTAMPGFWGRTAARLQIKLSNARSEHNKLRKAAAEYISAQDSFDAETDAEAPGCPIAISAAQDRLDEAERLLRAALAPQSPEQDPRIYPCARCGTLRNKAEGGTTFTVCDECWDKPAAPDAQKGEVAK